MATQLIPIDPDKKDDIYYRYKMPAVQVKVESSGNGIKTVIPNIHDICNVLNRPEEVLMRFFQFELGAQSTISEKDDKYLLMGKHADDTMQGLIYKFIKKFVLCAKCQNPETAVCLDTKKKSEKVTMVCGACGKVSHMDTTHRAYAIMCQHYERHPEEARTGKGAAEARKRDAATPAPAGVESPAAAGAAAEPPAAAKKTKTVEESDLKDIREDPFVVFGNTLKKVETDALPAGTVTEKGISGEASLPDAVADSLISQVVRMGSEYNLPEEFSGRLVIGALFTQHAACILSALKLYAPLLRRFSTVPELFFRQEAFDEKTLSTLLSREAKIQKAIIVDIAQRLAADKKSTHPVEDRMAVLLFMFFVEGIVKDSSILNYATASKTTKGIEPAVDKAMKAHARVVADWLDVQREEAVDSAAAPAAEAE